MNFAKQCSIAESICNDLLDNLPDDVRGEVDKAGFFFERKPDREDIAEGIEHDTLGFFDTGPEWAPRIRLFLENIWNYSDRKPEIFREEVRITLLHEIGHLLGWDESEIEKRGLG